MSWMPTMQVAGGTVEDDEERPARAALLDGREADVVFMLRHL